MARHKKLTSIEIILILAIIAVLVVWLFPRVLRIFDTAGNTTFGTEKSYCRINSESTSLPIHFDSLEAISILNTGGI